MAIIKIHDLFFDPFLSTSAINHRIQEIALNINQDYKDKNPLFIAVLNGAFIFAADLMRETKIDCEISFIKIASYQGTSSTETITELIGFSESIKNRDIIIIEDIIDTGLSMKYIIEQLNLHSPASIKIAALLFKKEALKHPTQVDYVGFEIENKFVIGYGLDYNGLGRNLPHIYIAK